MEIGLFEGERVQLMFTSKHSVAVLAIVQEMNMLNFTNNYDKLNFVRQ